MDEETNRIVFYDGECGLCAGLTGVALRRLHRRGSDMFFAPIGGETFRRRLSLEQIETLPDSIVMGRRDRTIAVRHGAVVELLREMGGGYLVLWGLARLVPRPLGDLAYRFIAAVRKAFSGGGSVSCGALPDGASRRLLP